jgi:mono/diheme cytochrome c family protein
MTRLKTIEKIITNDMHLIKTSGFSITFFALFFSVLLAIPPAYSQDEGAAPADAERVVDTKDDGAVPSGGSQPKALDPDQVAKGKTLFNENCAACHAVTGEVVVGPGLQGINERRPEAWLLSWVKNPQKVIASGDQYANELYNKFNKAPMPAFPFNDDQIRGILAYIKSAEAGPTGEQPGPSGNQVPAGNANTVAGGDAISSNLFIIVVVALLIVLLLVLVVLVMVVSLLSKVASNQPGTAGTDTDEFGKVDLRKVTKSSAFKAGAAILFILIAGKASIDGMYDVGIQQGYAPTQPIAFSHKLHAGQYEIQCRYCHTGVNVSKNANIPSANICMNCHNAIKRESPEIQKIYTAIEKDTPIEWVRVHNLPDLAYFNHAQHVNVGGVQCQQCHGQIEQMEVVQQRSSLTMGWCIDCHRKTDVNSAGNEYYDRLVALHNKSNSKEPLKVQNIGGLECSRCHY